MNAKTEAPEYRLDFLKWLLVALLVAGGIFGNSYFSEISLAFRVPALLAGALVALFIAVNTAKGAALWSLLKESVVEVRKVVWPTVQETHQTTLIVIVVVLLMAGILWALDSLLGWIASLILG
ncbi:preprotein translocase subunit SecE [Gilvimarinus sp. F26214L]|uniref:preprotein translocase subunit SecE n=1 Tax=Gilvimarinus sp. DZF01 TaxID=3461371 RepID=UPI0040453E64